MNNDTTIGLDLGNKKHKVVGLDGRGKVILKCELNNDKETLGALFKEYAGATVAMETGTHCRWISSLAKQCGCDAIVGNARMTTLTDLSQLTKSMVKRPVEEPRPAPKPKAEESTADREAAEVLAYFARPGGNAPQRPYVASRADPAKDRVAELEAALEAKDAALDALAEEKATIDGRIADLERQLETEREAHEAVVRERDRL